MSGSNAIRYVREVDLLALAWMLVTCLALPFAGFSARPPASWHPASLLVSSLVLGHRKLAGWGVALFAGGLFAAGDLIPGSSLGALLVIAYLIAVPVPFFLIDALRRDQMLRSTQFVLFNSVSPLSTRFERKVVEGELKEVRAPIAFFLRDWKRVPLAGRREREFLSRFHLGGGLYLARAESEFLQLFDSLNLYPYVVNPENEEAIRAFGEALRAGEELARYRDASGQLKVAAGPAPATPPQAVPFPDHAGDAAHNHLAALAPEEGEKPPQTAPAEPAGNRSPEASPPDAESSLDPNAIVAAPAKKSRSRKKREPSPYQEKLAFVSQLNPEVAA